MSRKFLKILRFLKNHWFLRFPRFRKILRFRKYQKILMHRLARLHHPHYHQFPR
jgi:hypothetical protein